MLSRDVSKTLISSVEVCLKPKHIHSHIRESSLLGEWILIVTPADRQLISHYYTFCVSDQSTLVIN